MKVLAFPRDPNPYQEQLYAPMREQGLTVDYLTGPTASHTFNLLCLPLVLLAKRLMGYGVLHLHWTYSFSLPWAGKFGCRIMQWYFFGLLRLVKMLGYKIVWTAHNAMPHQKQFANDLKARRFLGKKSDLVIAHSTSAEKQLLDKRIASYTVRVVPHGNYSEVYQNTMDRQAARRQLKLPEDAFVALFFGRVDSYKNVPALLAAAQQLKSDHPKLHVVVAGSCSDAKIQKQLKSAKRKLGKQLQLHTMFIKEEDVQTYFNAADVCALPFSEITTSGSAILSLSFGVPIIAPRKGALNDMPDKVGFFYDPESSDGVEVTLQKAMSKKSLQPQKRAALRYASQLAWPNIAKQTYDLFKSL
jgi:glycosyltransferase involved in cell wall biosynthesis